MRTLAQSAYVDAYFADEVDLPRAGSALENPFVFDASARELKAMAAAGLIEILEEHTHGRADATLIDRLRFGRVR